VLAFPGAGATRAETPARWLPSSRSILLGLLLLLAGFGAYYGAGHSSVFAVRELEVHGAPPGVAAQMRTVLAPLLGTSLVGFDRAAAERRLVALPDVASARFDRAFPHTIRIFVELETPVAVLRQGAQAWVVSARGRVLRRLGARPYPPLPRIWVPRTIPIAVDSTVSGDPAEAVQGLAPLRELHFPAAVRSGVAADNEVTLTLASGREIRLGAPLQLRLKLAIAAKILPLAGGAPYVDVSVPERPVVGTNSQVAG
jgi:cell division protein FtsQ